MILAQVKPYQKLQDGCVFPHHRDILLLPFPFHLPSPSRLSYVILYLPLCWTFLIPSLSPYNLLLQIGLASVYLASWLNLWCTGPASATMGCRKMDGAFAPRNQAGSAWLKYLQPNAQAVHLSGCMNWCLHGCFQWFSITSLWTKHVLLRYIVAWTDSMLRAPC